MIGNELREKLQPVLRRRQRLERLQRLAACWAGAALLGLVVGWLERKSGWASVATAPAIGAVGLVAALMIARRRKAGEEDVRDLARQIERRNPELDGRLITAVQQEPGSSGFSFLQRRLLAEVARHSRTKDWGRVVPRWWLNLARGAHWASLAGLILVCWSLRNLGGTSLLGNIAEREVVVSPGDTALERGESLVVLVQFGRRLPASVNLVIGEAGAESRQVPLVKSLADPIFGGSVPDAVSNFVYHVEYGKQRSRDFNVSVFEYPRVERADAALRFPAYTGLEPKKVEDTRRVSAVEGTKLDFTFQLNKPVAAAWLGSKSGDGEVIKLGIETNRAVVELKEFDLQKSERYEVHLVDAEGRTNKVAAELVFEALTNRTPEFKIASPRGDTRPSPLEEISFEGTVWAEFGVKAYGIGYTLPEEETKFIELGQAVPGKEKRSFQHLLRLETLHLQSDQMIGWFAWADDLGPDGSIRRSTSDLLFGEMRPFEEVFREAPSSGGESQQGGGGQQGGQFGGGATQLTEMQKQIISATWNLQRKHGGKNSKLQTPNSKEIPNPKLQTPKAGFVDPIRAPGGRGLYVSQEAGNSKLQTSSSIEIPNLKLQTTKAGLMDPITRPRLGSEATARQARTVAGTIMGQVETGRERPRVRRGGGESALNSTNVAKGGSYAEDLGVVKEAISQALEQAEEQSGRQSDARMVELWSAARKQMEEAMSGLDRASNSPALLPAALAAEEAAYQTLLKLQQREYQVTRNRNRSRGSSGGREQQMQRQLEQMDLTQAEDRYETQRQAQAPETKERSEQLKVMKRLQELARRQQDLNDRLKELQSSLQEARTEAEREEIRRRLKRLQEEEQQMLADTDELRQRMERPENQSRLAEQSKQLEEARQDIQRAAQQAAQGSASQALAAGTRAQRQLQQSRDQLRKQSSNQFADDLRQMRDEARELARQQQQINEKLGQEADGGRKSLSDSPGRKEALDQLERQKGLLTNLVERASRISQESEEPEPLLAKQLYDTVRKLSQDSAKSVRETKDELANRGLMTRTLYDRLKDTSETDAARLMDLTSDMLRQDFVRQAQETAQKTGGVVEELKRGIERASENIIGSDSEGLRLAQQELEQLTEELQREAGQAAKEGGQSRSNGVGGVQTEARGVGGTAGGEGRTNEQARAEARGGVGTNASGTEVAGTNGLEGEVAGQEGGGGRQLRTNGIAQPRERRPGDGNGSGGRTNEQANVEPQQSAGTNDQESASAGRRGERSLGEQAGNGSEGRRTDGGGAGGWDFDQVLNGNADRRAGPITGGGFGPWSDRLRDVEDMIEIPDLRTEVATVRERARLLRQQFKRDLKKPDWAVVQLQVMKPLLQVRDQLAEELARRESAEALVPIDRDPVPSRYSDLVRRYYEELGKER